MKKRIEPTILKGTRDYFPADMSKRDMAMNVIKNTFRSFGYEQIETPILSRAETILGKEVEEDDQKMAYTFKDYGGRDIALPFDLTMPFARFVAANYQELPLPFKRFQVQRVWRAERPQRGRLREFYQCDVDIIGSDQLICEAEIAKLIFAVFDNLKIKDITVRVNSRKLLNEVLTGYGVDKSELVKAIRLIDKLDKIGEKAVIEQLEKAGVAKAADIVSVLKPASSNAETLERLKDYDTLDLREFLDLSEKFAVETDRIMLDPSLARGLDYYTGITFEVVSNDPSLGTICAGGRYDDLLGMFANQDMSGIGISFGFERIMILLEESGLLANNKTNSQVLVTLFDDASLNDSINIYNSLISSGIPAELYMDKAKLSKQLKFADKKNIPFVVIQGPDEKQAGEVIIRRMSNGNQKNIPATQLAPYIENYYEAQ
ncbi:MAG TPA: histidine--tRNA ligase [Candidatus Saccharimonadales bacterium]|nr:histidine--tRNA ligase [Candidatus Saccharimonadales bacterium]